MGCPCVKTAARDQVAIHSIMICAVAAVVVGNRLGRLEVVSGLASWLILSQSEMRSFHFLNEVLCSRRRTVTRSWLLKGLFELGDTGELVIAKSDVCPPVCKGQFSVVQARRLS